MSQPQSNKDRITTLLSKSAKMWKPKEMATKLAISEPTLYTTINRMHKAGELKRNSNGEYTVTVKAPEKDPRQMSLFPEIELAGELEAAQIDEEALDKPDVDEGEDEDRDEYLAPDENDDEDDEDDDEDIKPIHVDGRSTNVLQLVNTIKSQRYLIKYLEARLEAVSWRNYKQRAHISGIANRLKNAHAHSKRLERS